MRIGVLGTGIAGQTVAGRLVEVGHEVTIGARQATNENAVAWASSSGDRAHAGSMADAAAFGEIVINLTSGAGALDALSAAGAGNLAGKVLIDVSNPLDTTSGFPAALLTANTDSLGEQIQRAFPDARVVKTLNTVNCDVMVNPGLIPGGHSIFVSGNDGDAKQTASSLLRSFGWSDDDIIDLGDISTARGPEMYLALWLRLYPKVGGAHFNVRVVKGG
jgi:predicted dinucleotide-binding enzyme